VRKASLWSSRLFQPVNALIVVSLVLNVALARRIQILNGRIAFIIDANALKVGAPVNPIELIDMKGERTRLTYDALGVPTLIYVMSPGCVWCESNNINMNALVGQAGARYRMFVVSLVKEGADEYRSKHGVSAPIWLLPPEAQRALAVGGTPTTVLISPKGMLLAKWVGAFRKRDIDDIEKQLNVTLPGPSVENRDGELVTVAPRRAS